jgi:transcriptional regulator with XRE-family HTH domain
MTVSHFHADCPSYILPIKGGNMATIKIRFGIRLFQLRNEAGMTQASLAEKTNLSVDSISRLERGERAPSLESIEKISKALKVRSSDLFNFDGEEIAALSESPFESLELWRVLRNKRSKQVKKITEIAKIVLK